MPSPDTLEARASEEANGKSSTLQSSKVKQQSPLAQVSSELSAHANQCKLVRSVSQSSSFLADGDVSRLAADRISVLHGKQVYDLTEIHKERAWQADERARLLTKQAIKREEALRRGAELGEPFALRKARMAERDLKIRDLCEAARYSLPIRSAAAPSAVPLPLPQPTHLAQLRQERLNQHERRHAENGLAFMPQHPDAAALARCSWAADTFLCDRVPNTAAKSSDERAAAIQEVRTIGSAGMVEALQVIEAWQKPSTVEQAATVFHKKNMQALEKKAATFVPYRAEEDDTRHLYVK